jgi:hypothetical protein
MKTLGIDVSSQAIGTASCLVQWEKGSGVILRVERGIDDRCLEAALNEKVDKIGLDVPLGWPEAFVDAVERHRRGEPFGDVEIDSLARRETDRWVWKNTLQLPLSLTTDRISYPAMRMARILGGLPDFNGDRSGQGKFVEVYPAAASRVWVCSTSATSAIRAATCWRRSLKSWAPDAHGCRLRRSYGR